MTAAAMPTRRSGPSAVSMTCAIAFFAAAGFTAKISPSITNTRPSATMKSAMLATGTAPRGERGGRSLADNSLFLGVFARLAHRVGKIAEEVGVGFEHHAGV